MATATAVPAGTPPAKKKPEKLPTLKTPDHQDADLQGLHTEEPLPVEIVEGLAISNLLYNIVLVVIVEMILVGLLWAKGLPLLSFVLGFVLLGTIVTFLHQRMWCTVKARMGLPYKEMVWGGSRSLRVYLEGFHFTRVTSSALPDNIINFQKHEDVCIEHDKDGKPVSILFEFACKGGLVLQAEMMIVGCHAETVADLGQALKFQPGEVKRIAFGLSAERLSSIGGRNIAEVMLANKDGVAQWISEIFQGEATSKFELKTGWRFGRPILKRFILPKETREILETKAKTDQLTRTILTLIDDGGLQAEDAAIVARITIGESKETVVTYRGIPPGVKTFAPGNTGIAVGGGKGGN